jgi:hypothetical protein
MTLKCSFVLSIIALATATAASAHHSAAVAFDASKPMTVSGVITSVRWENPHSWIYIDVKDETGKVVNWGFEASPPATLIRRGMNAKVLKPGAQVTVKASRGRDESQHFGLLKEMTFADGRTYESDAPTRPGAPANEQ